ncbi:MAG: hypothetical protein IPP05_09030 [Cytophagaceae bacterium]|nr:hypothetical protein [Cytophagaceae bacterium]
MKKTLILITFFLSLFINKLSAQSTSKAATFPTTSIGMVIYSNDVETIWNALRLANFSKMPEIPYRCFYWEKAWNSTIW